MQQVEDDAERLLRVSHDDERARRMNADGERLRRGRRQQVSDLPDHGDDVDSAATRRSLVARG